MPFPTCAYQVKITQRSIKHVLTERFYLWEDALELAQTDPQIVMKAKVPTYKPARYLEDVGAQRQLGKPTEEPQDRGEPPRAQAAGPEELTETERALLEPPKAGEERETREKKTS